MTSSLLNVRDLHSQLWGVTRLYEEYLNDFENLRPFFDYDFKSEKSFSDQIEVLKKQYVHRSSVIEALTEQNKEFGASERTFQHLRDLAEPNTFAIVTGQQVGLFGGPMYTLYKTMTAIKLAARLTARLPEYKFVPVFWLEGEDHDFEEVRHAGFLNVDGVPASVSYAPAGRPADRNNGAVGEHRIEEQMNSVIAGLETLLPSTEFRAPFLGRLRDTYRPPATMIEAFARLLNLTFPDDGLVFISVNDARLKKLLSPVFQREIQEHPAVSQLVIRRSAELEERYHAQIKTKALNLFLFHKGGRYMIEPRENDFSLKGTRHYIGKDELLRIAEETPELFSPNVALRPICQDLLLPTVAYVAGPSEISYFAQLQMVYRHFKLRMPVIYPRASATIVDARTEKVFDKFEITIPEFFANPEQVQRTAVSRISDINIDDMFRDITVRAGEMLNELKFGLNTIDPTLLGPLESTKEKIESHLRLLKEKTYQAHERKHEVALRQMTRAAHALFPNQSFQERELNAGTFINKFGPDIIRTVQDALSIDSFAHQILHMP